VCRSRWRAAPFGFAIFSRLNRADTASAICMAKSSNSSIVQGLPKPMLEGLPFQKLHRDERHAFKFVDVVNRADIRMIQHGRGASLALEAFQPPENRGPGCAET
jgi:hypothetical protein